MIQKHNDLYHHEPSLNEHFIKQVLLRAAHSAGRVQGDDKGQ